MPSPDLAARRRIEGAAFLLAFAACIPAANWLIQHVGTACNPAGPCVIPVAPSIVAPSGVLTIGLALVLRDLVQRRLGVFCAAAAIVLGSLMSVATAPPALVIASTTAFLLSEAVDLLVYTPLQRRGLLVAALVSSMVGLVVDSVLFLWLAFGNLEFLPGQIIGKGWMVLASLPALYWLRARDQRLGLGPA